MSCLYEWLRHVAQLWALPTPWTNLAVGLDQELSHLVSNFDNKDSHFKFQIQS